MSPVPRARLRDFLADPRRPAISDLRSRYLQYVSRYHFNESEVSDGVETQTFVIPESVRVRSVEVSAVSGGTVTMDVEAEGRSLFDGTNLPTSGAGPQDSPRLYPLHAGMVLTVSSSGSSGAPSGAMNTIINVEPIETLPQFDDITLTGGDRLRVSRREEARNRDAVLRSTLGLARDQTEAGQGQIEQIHATLGRNVRSLRYPNRFAFRGGQRAR